MKAWEKKLEMEREKDTGTKRGYILVKCKGCGDGGGTLVKLGKEYWHQQCQGKLKKDARQDKGT